MAKSLEEAQALLQNYRQQKQATQPVSSPNGETEQEKANRILAEYRAKKVPQPVEQGYVAPVSPLKGFAGAVDNALNPLVNAGEGAALSVANTGLGILGGTAKLFGADKFAQGVEDFRQQGFVKPTENSQKTIMGKGGKLVTDVASYMTPGGLPARIATNTAVGFGQSGGDVKAGLASGVIEGLGGPLAKLPVAKKFVGKVARTLAPGYTADVVQGLSGQRGEDRTGAAAFLPGAGTAFSAVLGAGAKTANTIQKVRNPQTHLNVIKKTWEVPEKAKSVKFDKAKEIKTRAEKKGFDVTQDLAEKKIILKDNIVDNKYNTGDLAAKTRADVGKGSAYLDEATKLADPKILREPSQDLYTKAIKNVDQTNIEGAAIARYLKKEASLQKETFGFNDIYNKKKYYGSKSHWKMGMPGDGIAEKANAQLNKVFKEKLLEQGKKAGVNVEDFLKMQEDQYEVADYLDALDGARIVKTSGQKIRGGILKAGGAIFGAKGGLYGSVAGYHGGGMIDKLLDNFPTPIRNGMLKDYQQATPQAQKQMIESIKKMVDEIKTIKKLPSPTTIYQGPTQGGKPYTPNATGFKTNPVVETANYSNQRSVAIPNNIPNTAIPMKAIPKTILPIKKSGKQSGMIRNPLATNVKIHSEDLGEMRDFLDVQTGAYKPSEKMILDNEIAVRRYVEDKFGKNTDNMNPKALARYIGPIVDKYYARK